MTWEFETAFPALKPGGLILSDDVLANPSFFDFCRKQNLAHYNVFNIGAAFARS
jgi:predicted O-methyltransferase YrrM